MIEAAVGHQCPECVSEGRRAQRSGQTIFGGTMVGTQGYVTKALIGVNVVMLVLSAGFGGGAKALIGGGSFGLLGGFTPLIEWGADVGLVPVAGGAVPFGISNGEYYRLLTSMFLHYGILHLLMNMWALWVFGRNLEAALGPVRFLVLYLLAGLGGGVAVYLLSPAGATVGASGAILGLFAALFVLLKRLGRSVGPMVPVLVINVLVTLAPGISMAGHVGGFIIGGLVGAAMAYAPRKSRNMVVGGVVAVLLVIFIALCVVQTQLIQAAAGV